MQSERSLLHSQVPATCPYPELAQSSPYPHIPFPEEPSYYDPPSKPGSLKFLSLMFPHQIPVYTSPLTHTRYILRLN